MLRDNPRPLVQDQLAVLLLRDRGAIARLGAIDAHPLRRLRGWPIRSAGRRASSHQDAALGFADGPSLASEKARDNFYIKAKSLAISIARSGAGPSRGSS